MNSKKKKNFIKVVYMIFYAIIILNIIGISVNADDGGGGGGGAGGVNGIIGKVDSVGQSVGTTMINVCRMVAVGYLAFIGLKYMTESPQGKADLKMRLIIAAVACIVVFAGPWLAQQVLNTFGASGTIPTV